MILYAQLVLGIFCFTVPFSIQAMESGSISALLVDQKQFFSTAKIVPSLLEKSQHALGTHIMDNSDDIVAHMGSQIDTLQLNDPRTMQEACEQLQKINVACSQTIEELKDFSFDFSRIYTADLQQLLILKKKIHDLTKKLYRTNHTFKNLCNYIVASLTHIDPAELDQMHQALDTLPTCISTVIEEVATEETPTLYGKFVPHKTITDDDVNHLKTSNHKYSITQTPYDDLVGIPIQIGNKENGIYTEVFLKDYANDYEHCFGLTHDTTQIISGATTPKKTPSSIRDYNIRIWDRETGTHAHVLSGHHDFIKCLALAHNNKYIISGSFDKTIRVWNRETRKCIQVLRGHDDCIDSVVLSPDDTRIIAKLSNGTIRIWQSLSLNALLIYLALKKIQHPQDLQTILDSQLLKTVSPKEHQTLRDKIEQHSLYKELQKKKEVTIS